MSTTPEPHDDLDERINAAVKEAHAHQSWDDFWAEVERAEADARGEAATETIRGIRVKVPHDLPLRFDRRIDRVKNSTSEDDIKALVADLFGADVLDAWIDAGMTSTEFKVVLRWGVSHGKGRPIGFREAYDLVKEDEQGKAGTRETDSTPTSGGSDASGGSSKRTSGANTGSRRKTSRA